MGPVSPGYGSMVSGRSVCLVCTLLINMIPSARLRLISTSISRGGAVSKHLVTVSVPSLETRSQPGNDSFLMLLLHKPIN